MLFTQPFLARTDAVEKRSTIVIVLPVLCHMVTAGTELFRLKLCEAANSDGSTLIISGGKAIKDFFNFFYK